MEKLILSLNLAMAESKEIMCMLGFLFLFGSLCEDIPSLIAWSRDLFIVQGV